MQYLGFMAKPRPQKGARGKVIRQTASKLQYKRDNVVRSLEAVQLACLLGLSLRVARARFGYGRGLMQYSPALQVLAGLLYLNLNKAGRMEKAQGNLSSQFISQYRDEAKQKIDQFERGFYLDSQFWH